MSGVRAKGHSMGYLDLLVIICFTEVVCGRWFVA